MLVAADRTKSERREDRGVDSHEVCDLLVIGGGINGAGIARDAAGRGISVTLVEQDDLASYTSSSSTKLIHGGLRYLEYYAFHLVREALMERERLLRCAPHIVWPLRFVLPYSRGGRPAWMLRLGLFIYDHLGGRQTLPPSQSVRLPNAFGSALRPDVSRVFVYSDCWVQDSRLVVLNARDAAEHGARIHTRTRLVAAERRNGLWHATVERPPSGERQELRARILVNAAGPWVSEVLTSRLHVSTGKQVRLVKGSHIVTRRLYEGEHAYILQNPDKRIVFAIPYEGAFTLIGTTDVPWEGRPGPMRIDADETNYLCESVSRWFAHPVTPADVVWSYSGVRPLYDDAASDAAAVTREYVLDLDTSGGAETEGNAALLSVFGGKITTYRRLAEHALDKLAPHLPQRTAPWTARAPLPGGDMANADFGLFLAELQRARPFLPAPLAYRLARAYGTRVDRLLGNATRLADLGEDLGGGLSEAEVDYLVREEWAQTPDDILWRRSKLGLHAPAETAARLAARLERVPLQAALGD